MFNVSSREKHVALFACSLSMVLLVIDAGSLLFPLEVQVEPFKHVQEEWYAYDFCMFFSMLLLLYMHCKDCLRLRIYVHF